MIDTSSIPLADLLPHGAEMTVIDRLVAYDEGKSIAIVDVRPESLFFENGGVPAWVGLEYMAQAVAAHAGFAARLRGEPPSVGFLLGTRSYQSRVAAFPSGSRLTIEVEPLSLDANLGAFHCTIVLA